jgi:hypothetical protein
MDENIVSLLFSSIVLSILAFLVCGNGRCLTPFLRFSLPDSSTAFEGSLFFGGLSMAKAKFRELLALDPDFVDEESFVI